MPPPFPSPVNADPHDPYVRFVADQEQLPINNYVAALDSNPDEAARSVDLGRSTGVAPEVVGIDQAAFEREIKIRAGREIIKDNPQLASYFGASPINAQVSHDDLDNLDALSSAVRQHNKDSIVVQGLKGLAEGFGEAGMGSWISAQDKENYPLGAATWSVLGGLLEGALRAGSGLITGMARAGQAALTQMGVDPETAQTHADNFIQAAGDPGLWASLGPIGESVGVPFMAAAHNAKLKAISREAAALEPYVKEGKIPSPGISEVADEYHRQQAEMDKEALGDMLKAAVATQTRERSPELLSKFLSEFDNLPDNIGVPADVVRALYGDKVPAADDGLLGWVPRLEEQLSSAEATGGDVQVPLRDWLAKVDPQVAKQLEDHVRVRPEGMTAAEAKEPINYVDAFHGSSHEFEAFSSEKIGTGEGAQSYGYGHYVAEAPEVAKSYAPAFQDNGLGPLNIRNFWTPAETKVGEGNLYQVRVNRHPDEFLDWDADMDAQPVGKKILASMDPAFKERLEEYLDLHDQPELKTLTGGMFHKLLERFASEDEIPGVDVSKHPTDDHFNRQASEYIGNFGAAGVKYLDQVSRDKQKAYSQSSNPQDLVLPKSTRNYVVFKDSDLEVIARNGEAVKAAREATRLNSVPNQVKAVESAPPEPSPMAARLEQLELPETTRMEDREVFAKANAIGMTVEQYKRYQKLIERRAVEDTERYAKRAEAEQRQRLTDEWKANRVEVRKSVVDEIQDRPDHDLDQLLRDGKVKLREEDLSDAQKAAFPKDWVARDGIHPDDLARLYDTDSGAGVVGQLETLVNQRNASGMKPEAFRRLVIEAETDRRMEQKYGNLNKTILEEVKDQVLSETQEDMLHEETLAAATQAGLQFPIRKEDYLSQLLKNFQDLTMKSATSDRFLAEAGRAGRANEMALLKGDFAEAFRQKQRQYNAVVFAREAKRVEKLQGQFERLADRFSARSIDSVEQEYTNWIHDILMRTGQKVKRSVQDLAESLERGPSGTTLEDFVKYKEGHDLREVPVAEFLLDPKFRSEVDNLTTKEFQDLLNSVKALAKNGADEQKVYKAGDAADLAVIKGQLTESLQRFKEKEYDVETGKRVEAFHGVRSFLRSAVVAHLQVEALFNRLDRFDPKGVWNQYVFRPLAEAANHEAKLERDFAKKLGAIKDDADLSEAIPGSPFASPFSTTMPPSPAPMTRKGLRATILNMGNESNFNKLASGYFRGQGKEALAAYKDSIKAWVDTHATKADWDWAQKVWDMLEDIHQQSNTMYRGIAGIEPESLQIQPVITPHGEYKGGYYPLMRHEVFGEDPKFNKDWLEGQGYVRATTPAGYTKQRTGAIYPLSLNLDRLPNQMKQMIHDISFRPAVIQASKFIYDKSILNEMKKHLGEEMAGMLQPWLKDVVNPTNTAYQGEWAQLNAFSDFMRQNVTTTLIGLNPSTVMKHGPTAMISSMAEVGPLNFLKAAKGLLSVNEETGETNWQFAAKNSEELQRRARNWVETMGGGLRLLEGDEGKFMAWRDMVTELSSKPVAFSDMLSAVPTWLAKYEMEMKDHGVHGDAVFAADKAVRQAHGSTAITSRSSVARAHSMQWFTGFFTFFNDLLNRQIETVWRAGEAMDLAKEGQRAEALKEGSKVVGRVMAYVIAPAIIEELVTPLTSDEHESWGMKAAKGMAFTLGSSWVGVRDLVNGVLNGRDPSAGLVSTLLKAPADVSRDLFTAKKVKPENIIKHGAQLVGFLTGMMPAQVGRTAEFGYKVGTGQEHPGPWGWSVGGRYGTLKHHSPTFDKWLRNKQ